VWGVPIVLALVLLIALGIVLTRSDPRLTGTNSVPLQGPVVGLYPRLQLCQPGQLMAKDSGRVRMFLSPANPDEPPETLVTIRTAEDGVVARVPGRYPAPGVIEATIDPPVRRTRLDAVVCIRNMGKGTVVLSGILTPFGTVRLRGKKLDTALTTLWYAEDEKSWLSELGAVIPRVGHARAGGGWAFWIAALLSLTALALALITAVRENTR